MKGYLNLDISSVNKWLLEMYTVRIILEASRGAYCINATDDVYSWKKNITSLRLHVNRIHPTSGVFF